METEPLYTTEIINDTLIGRILALRAGGAVRRYHTRRVIIDQTVAAHSHGVATLAYILDPLCSPELLAAALHHDLAEYHTGDTPATAKWDSAELTKILRTLERDYEKKFQLVGEDAEVLTLADMKLLKFCDTAELGLYSLEEYGMGNTYALEFLSNIEGIMERQVNVPNELSKNENVTRLAQYILDRINAIRS